jgi:hypothetical protein
MVNADGRLDRVGRLLIDYSTMPLTHLNGLGSGDIGASTGE